MGLIQTDKPGFVKDENGVILNMNDKDYIHILEKRNAAKKEKELTSRIEGLENSILDVKKMIETLVERNMYEHTNS